MVTWTANFFQIPAPLDDIWISGPHRKMDVTVTVASGKPGMLCVIDNGTYYNGCKPYANAAALAGDVVVLGIKERAQADTGGKLYNADATYEQYEVVPALVLIPGMEFYAYIVDDGDITLGTTILFPDASNMGGLKAWTAAKDGTLIKLFEPLAGKTDNANELLPVRYLGMAVDGEA